MVIIVAIVEVNIDTIVVIDVGVVSFIVDVCYWLYWYW